MRYCACGHVEGTHWGGDEAEEALVGHALPYRCHAKTKKGKHECPCTKFRLRRQGLRRLLPGSA
jgi:hypothetical protein